MITFVCINNFSKQRGEAFNPKRFLEEKSLDKYISEIFFYTNSVIELTDENHSNVWVNYSQSENIPPYACRNSLLSRDI